MHAYVVNCHSCGAVNRIPADREGRIGRCGSCHGELMPLYFRPRPLTDTDFDAFIRGFAGPVLVEFWAPWCPHCKALEPVVINVAGILAGTAAVVTVNTQENRSLAQRFDVRGIPALFLLKQGRIVDQLSGAQSSDAILSWFRRHG